MTPHRILASIYRDIKRSRFKKKWNIYKRVFQMSFDKTMLIYLLITLGYIGAAVFISGDFTHPLQNGFELAEEIGSGNFWVILSLYPLRYLFQSFRQPGLIFSSSEYQLSILPFGLRNIWNVIVVEKWVKRFVVGGIIWIILLLTPLSNTFTAAYILSLLVLDICMTAPLWKLYQKHFLIKLASFLGASIGIVFLINLEPILAAIVVMIGIVILNIFSWKHLMRNMELGKITEISDFKVWKMPLISTITKVPFKREKRLYVLQKFKFRRKRFIYRTSKIHHRLWHAYLIKNVRVLFQMIGALVAFLTAMAFVEGFIFQIGIAIAIYIYTKMSASLFYDRFKSDIIEVLPWDLPAFRRSFLTWNIYGGAILILPLAIYYGLYFTWWVPLQILLIISVSVYALQVELHRSSILLGKQTKVFFTSDLLVTIGLVAVVFSRTYPLLILLTIMYALLIINKNESSEV